jgi:hypothetical protein
MAKSFSISAALSGTLRGYGKHWVTLVLAGAIYSTVHIADKMAMGHYARVSHFITSELPNTVNSHDMVDKMKSYVSSITEKEDGLQHLLYGVLFFLLIWFLYFGLVKICLQISAGKEGDLKTFLKFGADFWRYIGASALMLAIFAGVVFSLLAVAIFLRWFLLPYSLIIFFCIALGCIALVYLTHFLFMAFCAADNAKSVTDSLACSSRLVSGNLGRVIGFSLILACLLQIGSLLVSGILLHILMKSSSFAGPEQLVHAVIGVRFLVDCFVTPLSVFGLATAYRQLK